MTEKYGIQNLKVYKYIKKRVGLNHRTFKGALRRSLFLYK